jgi:hypothetical protein
LYHAGDDALYHLHDDPAEQRNVISDHPELAATMRKDLFDWIKSARHSFSQGDYPGYQPQGIFLDSGRAGAANRTNR